MDSRIKHELDREDFRMRRLRIRAYGLRLNRTAAEEKIYPHLVPQYQFQLPLMDYIVDFVDVEKAIAVEIDGGYHLAQPRKDINRMWILYQNLGVFTIRFTNDEILADVGGCLKKIRDFENNPIPPTPWIETDEDRQKKQDRKVALKEIASRIASFELQAIGKTRKQLLEEFDHAHPEDELDQEVFDRIKEKLIYWPEEGYVAPGLQRVTARKLKINRL